MSDEKKNGAPESGENASMDFEDEWFNDHSSLETYGGDDREAKPVEPPAPTPLKRPVTKTLKTPAAPIDAPQFLQDDAEWERLVEISAKEAEIAEPETASYLLWQAAEILINKKGDIEAGKELLRKSLDKRLFVPAAEYLLSLEKPAEQKESANAEKFYYSLKTSLSDSSQPPETPEFVRKQAVIMGLGDVSKEEAGKLAELILLSIPHAPKEELSDYYRLAYSIALRNDLPQRAMQIADKWREAEDLSSEEKIEALISAANHAETVLADHKRAVELYSRVLRLKEAYPEAVRGLKRLLIKSGEFRDLAETYIVEANASQDKERAAFLYFSAGRILRDETEDKKLGLDMLAKSSELAPNNPVYLNDLADAYREAGDYGKLAETLDKLASVVKSEQHKVETLVQLGEVYNIHLNNQEKATAAYAAALRINPYHTTSMAALGRLYHRNEKWLDLTELFKTEIEISNDANVKTGHYYKLAMLYQERLNDLESAIDCHKKALELSPGYHASLQALAEVYIKQGLWLELCDVYQRQIEHETDINQRIFLWGQIAEIRETRLGNLEGAAAARKEQLALDDKYVPAMRALSHLFYQLKNWRELLEILTVQTELAADKIQKAHYFHQVGELFDEQINDEDKAEEAYKNALDLMPTYMPTLRALGRIYHRKQKWAELISMNRRELAVTEAKPARRALMTRTADIYEEHLKDIDSALEIYIQVKEENPDYIPVYRQLSRIYELRGEWKNNVEILEREAEITPDEVFKARILYQIGELKEKRLEDLEGALAAYKKALEINARFEAPLGAIIQLLESEKKYVELDAFISELFKKDISPEQKISLYHRQAKLREGPLADPAGARESLVRLLETAKEDKDAHYGMLRLSLRAGDLLELTNSLVEIARVVKGKQGVDFYFWAAEIKQFLFEKPLEAAQLYVEILNIEPYHIPTLTRLAEIYERHNVVKGLKMVMERLYKKSSGTFKNIYAYKLAMVLAERYNDAATAESLLREALNSQEVFLLASTALARLLIAQNRLEEAAAIYEKRLSFLKDTEIKLYIIKELAIFYRNMGLETGRLRELYEMGSDMNAFDPEIERNMLDILSNEADWEGAITFYRKKYQQASEPGLRAQQLLSIADIYMLRLKDSVKAAEILEEAVSVTPDDLKVMRKAAELSINIGKKEEAIGYLKKIIEKTNSSEEKLEALIRLAEVHLQTENGGKEATKYLFEAYAINPKDRKLLVYLTDISTKTEDYATAKRYIEEQLSLSMPPSEKIDLLVRAAVISNENMEDPGGAAAYLNAALEINRAHEKAIDYFSRLLIEHENYESLIELYRGAVAALGKKEPISMEYQLLIGDALLNYMNKPESATAAYQEALEIDPENPVILERLANCFSMQAGREHQALSTYRRLIDLDPFIPSAYSRFFSMFSQLNERDAAYCIAQILIALRTQHNNALFFVGENKAYYRGKFTRPISANDISTFLIPPGAGGPVKVLLSQLKPDLPKIVVPSLERYKVTKTDKVKSDQSIAEALNVAAQLLGIEQYEAYVSQALPFGLAVEATNPPTLIIGQNLLKDASRSSMMFIAGYLMGHLHEGLLPMLRMGPDRLRDIVNAAVYSQVPDFIPQGVDLESIGEIANQFKKNISRKVKKSIEEPCLAVARAKNIDFSLMAESARAAVARSAIISCNDIEAAINTYLKLKTSLPTPPMNTEELLMRIKGDSFMAEALKFYASQTYFDLRKRLGVGIFRE